MNILFYCPFKFDLSSKNISSLGGIESLNVDLCKELSKKKIHRIFLATYCKNEIKKKNLTNLPIKKILENKDNIKFDLIISSNDPNIFNRFKSSKKILWMHNTLSIEKSLRKKKFFSIIKNKIIAVFVSKYLKNKTSKMYFFSKRIIINNFLSKEFQIQNLSYNRKKIIVWSVQRDKGLNETIQMWIKRVYPKNPKLNFYVYGINKNKYKDKIKYLKNFNIYFFGRVSKNKLRNIYSKSLAMICLGYDETFCLNALEANACGLPLLTFGKTALKDYASNNYNSYIVKNYNDLSKKINFISNKKINQKIIINSFNKTKTYRLEKIIKSWIRLIKQI